MTIGPAETDEMMAVFFLAANLLVSCFMIALNVIIR